MAPPRKFFPGDEELGKKYDDRRHSRDAPLSISRSLQLLPRRPRRIIFGLLGLVLVVLFIKNIPTDLSPAREKINRPPQPPAPTTQTEVVPDGPPERSAEETDPLPDPVPDRSFDGPLKFYYLPKTLYSETGLEGPWDQSKAVLFAAADLKSVSDLLLLACEMAGHGVNHVHFLLTGRHEISIEGIKQVNGMTDNECPLQWHDGRPDRGPSSTDARMEESVKAAVGHVARNVHPRVVITHDFSREEFYFWKGVTSRAEQMGIMHINVPYRSLKLAWISKLDSSSLEVWDQVQVDILVQAPPHSAAGLIRLLKSLQRADYFGFHPALTIELPSDPDPALTRFLSYFTWPPHTQRSDFALRRRIQPRHPSPEDAALRTVDSVYPKHSKFSHVLVLSPQAELTPSYFHYLRYTILKYQYSSSAQSSALDLLGFSLELPSSRPTDGEKFAYTGNSQSAQTDEIPTFLWQAPNSNAALYFGDKWIEFQSFLSCHFLPSLQQQKRRQPNLISTEYPSWMDYMLEFSRARGYSLLYPAFASKDNRALVSVHNEPYHPPEEFASSSKPNLQQNQKAIYDPDKLLSSQGRPSNVREKILSPSSTISNLLRAFPGGLPDISSLDILAHSGDPISSNELEERTEAYSKSFRSETGRCGDGSPVPEIVRLKADDLFCFEDDGITV